MGELKNLLQIIRHERYINSIFKSDKYLAHREEAEIMRNVHAIEKGLSLKQPRCFFGVNKVKCLLKHLAIYVEQQEASREIICMAIDALNSYVNFHSEAANDFIIYVKNNVEKYNNYTINCDASLGGVMWVSPLADEQDYISLHKIIENRHSVRDFSGESVPMEKLKKALELAQRAPSACNRQGVRAYIIAGEKKELLKGWLEGTGGFSDDVDKYILITGRISAYRKEEPFQYIVSASIFAGFLIIALQSLGIGSCVIQRTVIYNKKWVRIAKQLDIPGDEQAVLIIATGMPKEKYRVPVSHRISYENQVKEL